MYMCFAATTEISFKELDIIERSDILNLHFGEWRLPLFYGLYVSIKQMSVYNRLTRLLYTDILFYMYFVEITEFSNSELDITKQCAIIILHNIE